MITVTMSVITVVVPVITVVVSMPMIAVVVPVITMVMIMVVIVSQISLASLVWWQASPSVFGQLAEPNRLITTLCFPVFCVVFNRNTNRFA